jgi:hypothetical protein
MSVTFILCLIIALIAVAYWRVTLVVAIAVLLAMLASGVNAVASGLQGGGHPEVSAVAPEVPGPTPMPPR